MAATGNFFYRFKVDLAWVADGQSAMQVPSGPFLRFEISTNNTDPLTLGSGDAAQWGGPIAGGATPTSAQIQTALQHIASDVKAQLDANGSAKLTILQNQATGGG